MDHQGLIKLGARKTPLAEAKGVSGIGVVRCGSGSSASVSGAIARP